MLKPTCRIIWFTVGRPDKTTGTLSAISWTVAPGRQRVVADFIRTCLIIESPKIKVVGWLDGVGALALHLAVRSGEQDLGGEEELHPRLQLAVWIAVLDWWEVHPPPLEM